MSLELCVIASGSSGNCSVLRTPGGPFLVDCGISPRQANARLAEAGVSPSSLRAICLTHLDRDHCSTLWAPVIRKLNLRVFCPADGVDYLLQMISDQSFRQYIVPFDGSPFSPVPGVEARTVKLAHDGEGSHAFRFDGFGTSIGLATDLGHVPPRLIELFCGVDILALESNYDPDLQRASGRPMFLQQRITGGKGHLSNAEALAAVKTVFDRCARAGHPGPSHVVLLHRSRRCNCPTLVRTTFERDVRIGPRLTLAEPFSRTAWMAKTEPTVGVGEQLMLAW